MSLAFVRGIHQWPMNSPHKGPVTWEMLTFDYFIMLCRNSVELVGTYTGNIPAKYNVQLANNSLITIKIWSKFNFALIQIFLSDHYKILHILQHEQHFVVIWGPLTELHQYELRWVQRSNYIPQNIRIDLIIISALLWHGLC